LKYSKRQRREKKLEVTLKSLLGGFSEVKSRRVEGGVRGGVRGKPGFQERKR